MHPGYKEKYLALNFKLIQLFQFTDQQCLDTWTGFNGNCYRFFKAGKFIQWAQAEEACLAYKAHLASIRDGDDMKFIHWMLIENKVVRKSQTYIGKFIKMIYLPWLLRKIVLLYIGNNCISMGF